MFESLKFIKKLNFIKQSLTSPLFFVTLLFFLFTFTPSLQLALDIKNFFPIKLPPSPLDPGKLYTIQSKAPIIEGFYRQKPLSLIKKKQFLFAVHPEESPSFFIYGIQKINLNGIFKHPEIFYFKKTLFVRTLQRKHPGSQLRIPSSVWKKVNNTSQIKKEKVILESLYKKPFSTFLTSEKWKKPLNSYIVSKYASPRRLPNGHSYLHTGTDYRAPVNTPIRSIASGKVAYVGHMTVPGNLVLISHGKGLFSRYLHLNKILVSEGQKVSKNTLLGLSGQTGRVEGPHLHFEVLWKGIPLHPEKAIDFINTHLALF